METKFLDILLKLDPNTKFYKKSFFTAGELLETYLSKDEKVVYPNRNKFDYTSLHRTYLAGVPLLLRQYNATEFTTDFISNLRYSKLIRVYNFRLTSYWWENFNINHLNFDFVLFFKMLSNLKPRNLLQVKSINMLLDNIIGSYSQIIVTYLGQTFLEKVSPVFNKSIWVFIPQDGSTVNGGISYSTLALAQIPVIFFDYMLFITNPSDTFIEYYSFVPTKFLELLFFYNSVRYFGFNARLSDKPALLNDLLKNNYSHNAFNSTLTENNNFKFLEQIYYYSSNPYLKLQHELENIEYYHSSTISYENFINIWSALITERIMFFDSLHNKTFIRQVERVWTNYIKYLDMHEVEEVIVDHRDIAAHQQALYWVWGYTNLSGYKLARIRVQNTYSRQYLNAYESYLFSTETNYSYLIDFTDEISDEHAGGEADLSVTLDEFDEEDDEILDESLPIVYNWDLEEDDPVLGVVFPYIYYNIFFDQFEYASYYYNTDELAKNYKLMAIYKPYNMVANGYKGFVADIDDHMNWFTSLLLRTMGSHASSPAHEFHDYNSSRTWEIKSFFKRDLHFTDANLLDDFIDDRSIDLSFFSVKKDSHSMGLTTYSIDNQFDIFLSLTRNSINPKRYDSEFPQFLAARFKRV